MIPMKETLDTSGGRKPEQQAIISEQLGISRQTVNVAKRDFLVINREHGTMAKPDDAYGIHYGWQVGGEKHVSAEDLPMGKFGRKTNLTVTYTEADKGKPAYYVACYECNKGEAEPW